MKRRTKIAVAATTAVALAGVGGFAVASGDRGTQVRIEAVATQDLVSTVTASGWIRPRVAVEIQSDIMGRIIHLAVNEGDAVNRGDLLLRIDPTSYEAAVARARAGVNDAQAREAQARAALLQAELVLRRAESMAAADSLLVSRQALDEARTEVEVRKALHESAVHGIAMARAALREAEDQLEKTVIRSPIDGVITRLNVEEGEMAIVGTMNNPGSLLLTVSDLGVMEAVVRVDETDIPELELGDSATIEIDAFPRQKFTGRVTEIGHSAVNAPTGTSSFNPSAQNQAIDFEVVITLDDPPPTLRPDLSATADIVTDVRQGALAIPIIALTVREKGDIESLPTEQPEAEAAAATLTDEDVQDVEGVFLVKGGKATFVPVEVGIAGAEHFQVLKGLAAGDSVVAGPYETIRTLENGALVRAIVEDGEGKSAAKADTARTEGGQS